MRRASCVLLVGLAACRFGGSEGDPFALVEPPRDAQADVTVIDAAEDVEPPISEVDASGAPSDAGAPDVEVAPLCPEDAAVADCNPVAQTGCVLGQCVVDQTRAATGRCVLANLITGATCSEDELATTCPAGTGCYDETCRSFCFCDGDCPPGECCGRSAEASDDGLIRVCESC